MAFHETSSSMSKEAIGEYLEVAQICLNNRKSNGGVYGYTAALLCFCVVEAMSQFLQGQTVEIDGIHQKITRGEPYRVLCHPLFDLKLTRKELARIKQAYRHPLIHNAALAPRHGLVTGSTSSVFFTADTGEINIDYLLDVVRKAWGNFDKHLMNGAVEQAIS